MNSEWRNAREPLDGGLSARLVKRAATKVWEGVKFVVSLLTLVLVLGSVACLALWLAYSAVTGKGGGYREYPACKWCD